jgi:hypothetical protein
MIYSIYIAQMECCCCMVCLGNSWQTTGNCWKWERVCTSIRHQTTNSCWQTEFWLIDTKCYEHTFPNLNRLEEKVVVEWYCLRPQALTKQKLFIPGEHKCRKTNAWHHAWWQRFACMMHDLLVHTTKGNGDRPWRMVLSWNSLTINY